MGFLLAAKVPITIYILYIVLFTFSTNKHYTPNSADAANVAINNRSVEDWTVVDLIGDNTYKPLFSNGHSTVRDDDVSVWPVNTYYWQAPEPYYKWKIYTYAGDVKFLVSHVVNRGDTSGKYLDEPDLVLEGGSQRRHMKIGYRLPHSDDILEGYDKNQTISMPLQEDGWFYIIEEQIDSSNNNARRLRMTDRPVSREDFSLVLAGLDRSLIRAKYHMDQIEGDLFDVRMRLNSNTSRTIECDNDCSGALLDDLDLIDLIMDEIRRLLPFLKDGPWQRLRYLADRADKLEALLKRYTDIIDLGKKVLEKYDRNFAPETLVDLLELRSGDLAMRAPGINTDAYATKLRAQKMLDDLLNGLMNEIRKAILALNEQGFGPGGMSPDKLERIIQASEIILRELRARNFEPYLKDAENELRRAKSLLEKIKTLLIDPEKSAELLKRLEHLTKVLVDFSRIIQDLVLIPAQKANDLVAEGKKKYLAILDLIREADERAKQSQDELDEAKRLLDLTKQCLAIEAQYLDQLPRQLIEINASIHEIEVKRSILTQVNPDYQKKYVDKCRDHGKELIKKAQELEGLFNATRDVADYALRAANAYKQIAAAIRDAEMAAKRAYDAAEKAYKIAVPEFDESLAAKALAAKKKSYELLEKATMLRDKDVQRLAIELEKRRLLVESLFKQVATMMTDLDNINQALKQLAGKNLLGELQEIDAFLNGLFERLAKVHKKLQLLHDIIYNTLLPQFKLLSAGTTSSLANSSAILDNIKKDLQAALKYSSTAKATLLKLLKLEEKLDLDLDLLRRKIQLGHQEAGSIHQVSIMPHSSSGICTRSYFVPAIMSASNQDTSIPIGGFYIKELKLIWSLHSEESESLLLFIGSKVNDEFLSIEMFERHIRLVYNLNSFTNTGIQVLSHPRQIETNDNQLQANNAWYKIQVSISDDLTLKLSVKPMTKAQEVDAQQVSNILRPSYSSDSSSKLRVSPYGEADIHFMVGGLPPTDQYSAPKQIKSSKLAGCLYDVSLNEQQIGLWNFKTNSGCEGCMEGQPDTKDMPATYSFTGASSYSTVAQNQFYDKNKYMVSMSVRTNDQQSAIIFLSISTISNNYFSIFISEGKIGVLVGKLVASQTSYPGLSSNSWFDYVLSAHYDRNYQYNNTIDSDSLVKQQQFLSKPIESVILTTREYNNNRWIRITAEKDYNKLVLAVEDEYKEAQVDEKLVSLDMDSVFVGGVWPLIRPKIYANTSLHFNSLTGCVKDVQLESTPVDLLKRHSYGVETGCPETRVSTKIKQQELTVPYPLPMG